MSYSARRAIGPTKVLIRVQGQLTAEDVGIEEQCFPGCTREADIDEGRSSWELLVIMVDLASWPDDRSMPYRRQYSTELIARLSKRGKVDPFPPIDGFPRRLTATNVAPLSVLLLDAVSTAGKNPYLAASMNDARGFTGAFDLPGAAAPNDRVATADTHLVPASFAARIMPS